MIWTACLIVIGQVRGQDQKRTCGDDVDEIVSNIDCVDFGLPTDSVIDLRRYEQFRA